MKEKLKSWLQVLKARIAKRRFYRKECRSIKWQVVYDEYMARISKARYESLQYDVQYAVAMNQFKQDQKNNKQKPNKKDDGAVKSQRQGKR